MSRDDTGWWWCGQKWHTKDSECACRGAINLVGPPEFSLAALREENARLRAFIEEHAFDCAGGFIEESSCFGCRSTGPDEPHEAGCEVVALLGREPSPPKRQPVPAAPPSGDSQMRGPVLTGLSHWLPTTVPKKE